MAHEMKGWVHVRVKCPDCGGGVYVSWPPDDRGDHLVKHGSCRVFRLGRKDALLQQFASAVQEEEREKRERRPEIGREGKPDPMQSPLGKRRAYKPESGEEGEEGAGGRSLARSPYRKGPQRRENPVQGGDGEEEEKKVPTYRTWNRRGRMKGCAGKDELGRDRGDVRE